MDKKQLRQFIIDNAVGDKDGSINAIMEAIDQYKDACVNDALGQNLSPGPDGTWIGDMDNTFDQWLRLLKKGELIVREDGAIPMKIERVGEVYESRLFGNYDINDVIDWATRHGGLEFFSPAGIKVDYVFPTEGRDLCKMINEFYAAAPTIFTNSAGNTIPSLKPLNWEVHTGDMLRAKCPNSGAGYLVGKSNDGGHFISEVRQHALWKKIEGEYDTMQAAKAACENHRNQRLRDLLQ